MNIWTWGFALSLTMTGIAAAQPGPPLPPPAEPSPAPVPETAPAPAPAPAPPMPPTMHRDEPQANAGRPTDLSFGIGLGYVFPTSLQTPNTTSVRLRLASGLTFEPQLVLATTSTDLDTGVKTTNKQNEVTVGSLVRYPLAVRGKVDLELVGSAAISNHVVDPDGADNNRTTTTLDVGYGAALAYWLSPHWNLSFTASNPLLTYSRTRQESAAAPATVNKTTTIGLVFEPQVALMIHLYD